MIAIDTKGKVFTNLGVKYLCSESLLTKKQWRPPCRIAVICKRWLGINAWDQPLTTEVKKKIENHWKDKLLDKTFDEQSDKPKFYVLSMFPYPSGALHMGHVRVYCVSDVLARYYRMTGKNVFHPMGWDAFGLPAENAALEKGIDPDSWTRKNIANMKKCMEEFNFSFDWDREFATCDSDYYKWTQLMFLKLYKSGMVFQKKALVNWDPIDKTVLADEQIDEEGRSWRSGALVQKKALKQWFIRTSKFAKNLYNGLFDPEMLKGWEDVAKIQKHSIGECVGTTIDFEIVGDKSKMELDVMPLWMNSPEYINRAKFVAVAPQCDWDVGADSAGLLPYQVVNPITKDTLPVYVTQHIEYRYGFDPHLGFPDFNELDKSFADKVGIVTSSNDVNMTPEELTELREKICAEARARGIGGYPTSPSTKDWLISRQRYWGTPIPIIYCKNCGPVPVSENELPVRLPIIRKIVKGTNHLAEQTDWFKTTCPKCGGEAERETDTMDTFVDSSWYYLRFLDHENTSIPYNVEKANKFMPVDIYLGGKEHAVLHLYYSRFFCHFLHSIGLVKCKEPFRNLLSQGMVKGKTYCTVKSGSYVVKDLVEIKDGAAFHKETKEPLIEKWEKMSKSKFNGVEPSLVIDQYGVDTTRLMVLSGGNPKSDKLWTEDKLSEILIWQERLWNAIARFRELRSRNLPKPQESEEFQKQEAFLGYRRNHFLIIIKRNLEENYNIGGAIACMESLVKTLKKSSEETVCFGLQYERTLAASIVLLAPLAPTFASELWAGFIEAPNRICASGEISWDVPLHHQSWPLVDDDEKTYNPLGFPLGQPGVTFSQLKLRNKKKSKKKAEKVEPDLKQDSVG